MEVFFFRVTKTEGTETTEETAVALLRQFGLVWYGLQSHLMVM